MSSARPAPYVIHDTQEEAERRYANLPTAVGAKTLAQLRAVPAERLVAAQHRFYDPHVDGYFFPEQPRDIWAAGKQNDVPAMLSFQHDESNHEMERARTAADYRTLAAKIYGAQVDTFLRLYPVTTDADVAAAVGNVTREAGHFGSMSFYARTQRLKGKAPVYLTDFARAHPYTNPNAPGNQPGAYHGSGVPYWFENLEGLNRFQKTRSWTPWDYEMSAKMADALAAFAKTGNPSTAAIKWPEWTIDAPKYVEFGNAITVKDAPKERIEFMWSHESTPHHNKPFPNFAQGAGNAAAQ
jgi:para-nitrobenzyl esterase